MRPRVTLSSAFVPLSLISLIRSLPFLLTIPLKTEKSESGEGNSSCPNTRLKTQQAAESGDSDLSLNENFISTLMEERPRTSLSVVGGYGPEPHGGIVVPPEGFYGGDASVPVSARG